MKRIFTTDVKGGFLELYDAEGSLVLINALRRGARGVQMEIPLEEAADLAEALLRFLGPATAESVFASTLNKGLVENAVAEAENP